MKSLTGITLAIVLSPPGVATAQAWTMQQCMQYAVEHNHEVRQRALEIDSREAGRTAAIGSFLPEVSASVGAQYNFGRAIDPETNGYTDVSTFYNGYSLSASLSLFDGFARLHALKAAKAGVLMGRHTLRQQQDQTALSVMQAYVSTAYYEGMVKMAEEHVEEATLLLRQVRALEAAGRKSPVDVALVESQQAEAAYELTRQQNLLASALLELKTEMALPMDEELTLNTSGTPDAGDGSGRDSGAYGAPLSAFHPSLQAASYGREVARHEWHQARASLYPTLSLGAGLSTTYYHTLHTPSPTPLRSQLDNNMGQYVGATLSIPLFDRLHALTSIRRSRNSYQTACEAYEAKRQELEKLSREAWQDWQACLTQTEQLQKKVEADSLAYRLTRRRYEEGLATAIDLHTTAVALLGARASLLQCRLTAILKQQLVRYYKGETIWTE